MLGKQRDILAALAKRRERYIDHIQPVEKVSRKRFSLTSSSRSLLVAAIIRASNFTGIVDAPTGVTSCSCNVRSSRTCRFTRLFFADLIQEEGAAPGRAKQPFIMDRARKRALCMPEKLAFKQGFGQGAAVHRQKRLSGPRAVENG